jgi:formate hydrogenlyase subunit 4
MFRLAPVAGVVTAALAALLLPLDGRRAPITFDGDFVAFAYLLALGRFVLVLAALDTGSSFEGMGASREVTVATFAEPALFLAFVALVLATGSLSLGGALGGPLVQAWPAATPALAMVAASLFLVLLAEGSRVPVDDPATHLELTMIHEVMVLDHSGPDLAAILYANALKLGAFAAILLGLLVPRDGVGPLASAGLLVAALVVVGAAVGVVESVTARLKLPKVPLYIAGGGTLGLFGLILLLQ